jgi:hypothetical protein
MTNDLELGAILSDVRSGDEVAVRVLADHYQDRREEVLAAAIRSLPDLLTALFAARQALVEDGPSGPSSSAVVLELDSSGRWGWRFTGDRRQPRDDKTREGRHLALAVLFAPWDEARPGVEFLIRRLKPNDQVIRYNFALRPLQPALHPFTLSCDAVLELGDEDRLVGLREALLFRLARHAVRERERDRAAGGVAARRLDVLTDDPRNYQLCALSASFVVAEPAVTVKRGPNP